MQATVLHFDPDTGGSVVLDDGVELPFAVTALAGTGLRHLRAGQRVTITVSGRPPSQSVQRVQILTLR